MLRKFYFLKNAAVMFIPAVVVALLAMTAMMLFASHPKTHAVVANETNAPVEEIAVAETSIETEPVIYNTPTVLISSPVYPAPDVVYLAALDEEIEEPAETFADTTDETTKIDDTTQVAKTTAPAPKEEPIPDDFVVFTTYQDGGNTIAMPLSEELQYHAYQMAQKYNVPCRVVMGLMGVETRWTANIGVVNGYVGLGCLSEKYHVKTFAAKGIDIYTPKGNIEAICALLRGFMDIYNNDIHKALMAYNGGGGYASDLISRGVTQTAYSRKVLKFADSLK